MKTTLHRAQIIGVALLVLNPQLRTCAQGSLTPPGAPGPSFKTLSEIEPRTPLSTNTTPGDASAVFIITNSGTFYLTTNVVGTAGKQGISIRTNNVVVDLNGFTMLGSPGGSGISVSSGLSNLKLRNGQIIGWGQSGINASGVTNVCVEGLTVASNILYGMLLGEFATVTECKVLNNGNDSGVSGIFAGSGSQVRHCTVMAQKGLNGRGIQAGGDSQVVNCTVASNSCANGFGIIVLGFSSLISECNVGNNRGTNQIGISASVSGTVRGCSVTYNAGNGIVAAGECLLQDNLCARNNDSGIQISGSNSRVENNHLLLNNVNGLRVVATNGLNLIIRNSASGNLGGNYNIAPGNRDAQKLTGGSNFISTDPWANFSF